MHWYQQHSNRLLSLSQGYIDTPHGPRTLSTVWAQKISDECKRRFYKNWSGSKKKAFVNYAKTYSEEDMTAKLDKMKKYCSMIRIIAHTQIAKMGFRQKKAHIMEIQVNGGDVAAKVDWAKGMLEQPIAVDDVFKANELVDCIGVSGGGGTEGVVNRWGVTRLPRKTHRGLRKVACIGSWHPARVGYTIARAGQKGYHHRTEVNKKIYLIGKGKDSNGEKVMNATTGADLTEKRITPLGGFPHYGVVDEDFLLMHGTVIGKVKRCITLRKQVLVTTCVRTREEVDLKFIDTSSKFGHGRFQTKDEKDRFMGVTKPKIDFS